MCCLRYCPAIICTLTLYRTGRQHRGDSPTLFEKCCGFFKVPRIGLAEVGRLGQRLNVPTQGQTGDERPFSLTAPGSNPQPGIEPGPHWWEADARTTRPPEHPLTCYFCRLRFAHRLLWMYCNLL